MVEELSFDFDLDVLMREIMNEEEKEEAAAAEENAKNLREQENENDRDINSSSKPVEVKVKKEEFKVEKNEKNLENRLNLIPWNALRQTQAKLDLLDEEVFNRNKERFPDVPEEFIREKIKSLNIFHSPLTLNQLHSRHKDKPPPSVKKEKTGTTVNSFNKTITKKREHEEEELENQEGTNSSNTDKMETKRARKKVKQEKEEIPPDKDKKGKKRARQDDAVIDDKGKGKGKQRAQEEDIDNEQEIDQCHECDELLYNILWDRARDVGKMVQNHENAKDRASTSDRKPATSTKAENNVDADEIIRMSFTTSAKSKGKQKAKEQDVEGSSSDLEFYEVSETVSPDSGSSTKPSSEKSGIECEICCNENIPIQRLTQCPDGHLFCLDCARQMAEIELGLQRTNFPCMSIDGCAATFHENEVKRFLSKKSFDLWKRLCMIQEIKSAEIPGLESCPFCDFACILEDYHEAHFVCLNKECERISCRTCKKADHRPRTCSDVEREEKMDDSHKAEEKLSETLVRRCPKPNCKTPIVKDEGLRSCNKMTCPNCRTIMCYVCRKDVTKDGYAHFHDPSFARKDGKPTSKCPLWDDTTKRHEDEVAKARKEIGKLAPKITSAEKEDAKSRKSKAQMFVGHPMHQFAVQWRPAEFEGHELNGDRLGLEAQVRGGFGARVLENPLAHDQPPPMIIRRNHWGRDPARPMFIRERERDPLINQRIEQLEEQRMRHNRPAIFTPLNDVNEPPNMIQGQVKKEKKEVKAGTSNNKAGSTAIQAKTKLTPQRQKAKNVIDPDLVQVFPSRPQLDGVHVSATGPSISDKEQNREGADIVQDLREMEDRLRETMNRFKAIQQRAANQQTLGEQTHNAIQAAADSVTNFRMKFQFPEERQVNVIPAAEGKGYNFRRTTLAATAAAAASSSRDRLVPKFTPENAIRSDNEEVRGTVNEMFGLPRYTNENKNVGRKRVFFDDKITFIKGFPQKEGDSSSKASSSSTKEEEKKAKENTPVYQAFTTRNAQAGPSIERNGLQAPIRGEVIDLTLSDDEEEDGLVNIANISDDSDFFDEFD